MNELLKTGAALLATAWLLAGCGGGGTTSTTPGGGTTSGTSTTPGGGGTPASGTPTPASIAWDSDNDGKTDGDDTPYSLGPVAQRGTATPLDEGDSYNASADNPYNDWIKELTDAAEAGEEVVQVVLARIVNLRDGWDADRQNEDPGIPLADFTTVSGGDRVAAPRPIVRNKGISRGIAEEAAKDIAAIQAQVANLEAIRTKARADRDALAAEIARLRTEAAGLDRPDDPATPDIDESGKAQRERARADRIRTVTIPALETARDALDQPLSQEARTDLEDEIARLKDLSGLLAAKADLERQKTMLESELTPLEDEQKALQARLALFDDGNAGNDPTDAGCSSTSACQTALNAKTDEVNAKASAIVNKQVEIDAQETSINTRRSEIAAKEEEIATDDARKEAFDAKQAEIDAEEGRATDIDAQADRHAKQQDAYEDDVIPDLEDKLAEIDNHLENIGPSVQTAADRLAAERLVVSEHAQASLILDRLAGAAGSGTLTVRKTQDASELDTAGGDAVFARAPRPAAGLDGEGVLRALATAGGRPDAVTDEDHAQSLANLNEALADHWRIDLTGFLVVADTGLSADDRAALDGTTGGQYVRGTFRGVYGTFYCALSAGCKDISAGVPGAFADGWHFTPAALTRTGAGTDQDPYVYAVGRYDDNPAFGIGTYSANYVYTDADGDGTYEVVPYVDYGIWLTEDGGGAPVINSRIGFVGPDSLTARGRLDVTTPADSVNGLEASATYQGTARGLAARRAGQAVASGHFDADVRLEARFGASPTLGGRIDNFRSADPDSQGTDHVNTDWAIDLRQGQVTDNGVDTTRGGTYPDNGRFQGEDVTGEWSAFAYGDDAGERPDGFSAAFDEDGIDQGADGDLHDDGAVFGLFDAPKVE